MCNVQQRGTETTSNMLLTVTRNCLKHIMRNWDNGQQRRTEDPMSIRLTSDGDLKSVLDGRAMAGQALLGCLLMSSFQVSSLLGAMATGHTHYFRSGIL